jgi:transposase
LAQNTGAWITGKNSPQPEKFFQVDARRKGTNGRREIFADESEARKRATKIVEEFSTNGAHGLTIPPGLRSMAEIAAKILEPYGKTVLQAAEHYRAFLTRER